MATRLLEQYLLNPLMCFLHYTRTHTHTKLHTSQEYADTQTMNMLTFYQTTLFTACLITLISYLHTQYYACIDVFSDGSAASTTYYILPSYMGTDLNVCVYALSDSFCHWTPYYTHHKHKGGHQYVCVDVLSDGSDDWMPYCTLHRYKGAHHYVCVYVLSVCCF